jgi:hypothetical protein
VVQLEIFNPKSFSFGFRILWDPPWERKDLSANEAFMLMWHWPGQNKEWLFSGAGIPILAVLVWFIKKEFLWIKPLAVSSSLPPLLPLA